MSVSTGRIIVSTLTYHRRLFHESFHLCFTEVGHTNRSGLATFKALLHGFVRVHVVLIALDDIAVGVLWLHHVAPFERSRPVHQVQVDIVCAQIFERSIQCLFDIIRVVRIVPQFRSDKDLSSRHTRLLDGSTDCRLGAVYSSSVNVPIACLERSDDCWLLSFLILPCAETDGRNLCSIQVNSVAPTLRLQATDPVLSLK